MTQKHRRIGGRTTERIVESDPIRIKDPETGKIILNPKVFDHFEEQVAKRRRTANRFEFRIEEYEEAMREILRDAGLPDRDGVYAYTDAKEWRPLDRKDELSVETGQSIETAKLSDLTKRLGFEPYGSREWYAATIIEDIAGVRAGIKAGNAALAAMKAFDLGNLVREALFWIGWEPHAARGKKIADGFKEGREKGNRERQEKRSKEWARWSRAAEAIRKKHPRWGKRAIAERVKEQLDLKESVETIRKRI